MRFLALPLSWSAYRAWQQNVNQYALYRLGYLSRMPALHRGIEGHARIQDVLMRRADLTPDLVTLYNTLLDDSYGELIGVEVSAIRQDPPMTGRLDFLWVSEGVMAIGDLKTGRSRPEHIDQLHWYAACVEGLDKDFLVGPLYIVYWNPNNPQNVVVQSYAHDIDRTAELMAESRKALAEIRSQQIPEEIIVPVHGTTFVDTDLGIEEGTGVDLLPESTVTDDGETVWGIRVYHNSQPLGWIPDSLKTRIQAETSVTIFSSRATTAERNGYVRLSIPSELVDWHGIAE